MFVELGDFARNFGFWDCNLVDRLTQFSFFPLSECSICDFSLKDLVFLQCRLILMRFVIQ